MDKEPLITVSWKNIREGKVGRYFHCPIALAMKETGMVVPGVGSGAVSWRTQCSLYGVGYTADLPEVAIKFVKNFDAGEEVGPISFHIKPRLI